MNRPFNLRILAPLGVPYERGLTVPTLNVRVVQVEANIEWRAFRARGGNWIAICDPLGLTIQSETYASLMEDIAETLNAMLHDLVSSNDLERFFRERGWQSGPIPRQSEGVWFDVPFVTRAADRDREAVFH